jgi:gluconate 2-dehydrogenase gamma chain
MNSPKTSRRWFLGSAGSLCTSAWLASNWPAIVSAAEHAHATVTAGAAAAFSVLESGAAADIEAIAAQIVPSGATPGAREARVVYFIDRALGTFFADWKQDFASGLDQFQSAFRATHAASKSFAAVTAEEQRQFLTRMEYTPFFDTVRLLTILGLLTSPKYGGNQGKAGWKLIGFSDEHVFQPPFGYYDRDYAGFVPYTKPVRS